MPIRTRSRAPAGHLCASSLCWPSIAAAAASSARGNAKRNESPCRSTSSPPCSRTAVRRISLWSASASPYVLPSRFSSCVDPSMSVKRKVTVPVRSSVTGVYGKGVTRRRSKRQAAPFRENAICEGTQRERRGFDPRTTPSAFSSASTTVGEPRLITTLPGASVTPLIARSQYSSSGTAGIPNPGVAGRSPARAYERS
jgi:hypothetical protein